MNLSLSPSPAWANEPPESYSRYETDPFEVYSYDNVQQMVSEIRAEGHAIPKGHLRIFINAANKEALRQKIAANYTAWMQELVNLADANFGKVITDPGGHWNEPDAQPVILANALIHQLGSQSQQAASKTGTLYLGSVALAPGDTITLSLVGFVVTCGDPNKDGKADIADAVLLAQVIVGSKPTPQPPCIADLNGDGRTNVVDLRDVLLIIKFILGKGAKLSCCGG